MAEIDDADLFHETRGNTEWADMDEVQKVAALARASDYILAHYRIKSTLSEDEQKRFSSAKFLLAMQMHSSPDPLRSAPVVKRTKEKLDGVAEEETEYFEAAATADPYPLVTGLLAPLAPSAGGSFRLGRATL